MMECRKSFCLFIDARKRCFHLLLAFDESSLYHATSFICSSILTIPLYSHHYPNYRATYIWILPARYVNVIELRIPHISTIQRYPYNLENFASAGRVVSLVSTRICSITPHIKDHILTHASFVVIAMVIIDCFFFPRSSITIDYL